VRQLTTPAGMPASCTSAQMARADSGVASAGLMIAVHPAASAGANYHA